MSYRPGGPSTGFGESSSPQQPEVFSLIDRHSIVEGTFTSSRDLRIEGEMRGTLHCEGLLYIAEGANIDATVEASHITVAGHLQGDIVCRGKLQIMSTGRVFATVNTESLVINEGAIYEGALQMESGGAPAIAGPAVELTPGEESTSMLRRFGADEEEEPPESLRRREE